MLQARIKWNKKYRKEKTISEPSRAVSRFFSLASGRKALDIAAGNGRNAVFLANHDFVVHAVDISDAGLAQFAGNHPRITPICADLDNFDIPRNHYDLIVNTKFLNRRLFPYIYEGLVGGGLLIFETFLEIPDKNAQQPHCRDYLLRPNELLHAFIDLKIVYYNESNIDDASEDLPLSTLIGLKKVFDIE